jgi:hypothetical protein
MADAQMELERLTQSLEAYDSFPLNLISTHVFPHDLELCRARLRDSDDLFQQNRETLVLRDLVRSDAGKHLWSTNSILLDTCGKTSRADWKEIIGSYSYHDEEFKGTSKLRPFLSIDRQDPYRRYW